MTTVSLLMEGQHPANPLTGEPPCNTCSGEISPSVARTEARRGVHPKIDMQDIFIFIDVIPVGKERDQASFGAGCTSCLQGRRGEPQEIMSGNVTPDHGHAVQADLLECVPQNTVQAVIMADIGYPGKDLLIDPGVVFGSGGCSHSLRLPGR